VDWLSDATTSNLSELIDGNGTSLGNGTLGTGQGAGEANAILAASTIKIIYLVIGQFHT